MSEIKNYTINMGPQHPATHGVLRVVVELDGEWEIRPAGIDGAVPVRISPNGDTAIFTLKRVDPKTEKKYSNLWVVPTSRGRWPCRTQGRRRPCWPKGREGRKG